jgi:ribonuclease P protein component
VTVSASTLTPVPLWSIRDAESFAAIRARGVTARESPFVVSVLDLGDGQPPRLGLAIGRIVGNAVVRNRLRRRVKATLATETHRLVGHLVMVRALPGAAEVPATAARARLLAGVGRAVSTLHGASS